MSNCNFTIPFAGDADTILAKAKSTIESQDGIFNGDASSGFFDVTVMANTIKGDYQVTGQLLKIVITSKPFFLPCSTIEGLLRSKLS